MKEFRESRRCGVVARLSMVLVALLSLTWHGHAQDISWAVEETPFASAVLLKALEKAPSFTAKVEVVASGKDEPSSSAASGTVLYDSGKLRWEVKVNDVKSPQLSQSARTAVRQINGDRILIFTRMDTKGNYLVLAGAHACLHQDLPEVKLTRTKVPSRSETIDGIACTREAWSVSVTGGSSRSVTSWKAKSLRGVLCQTQIIDGDQVLKVRFKDIQFGRIPEERFRVPGGLSQYESMEDLVQSIVLDKMRKKLGLR